MRRITHRIQKCVPAVPSCPESFTLKTSRSRNKVCPDILSQKYTISFSRLRRRPSQNHEARPTPSPVELTSQKADPRFLNTSHCITNKAGSRCHKSPTTNNNNNSINNTRKNTMLKEGEILLISIAVEACLRALVAICMRRTIDSNNDGVVFSHAFCCCQLVFVCNWAMARIDRRYASIMPCILVFMACMFVCKYTNSRIL